MIFLTSRMMAPFLFGVLITGMIMRAKLALKYVIWQNLI